MATPASPGAHSRPIRSLIAASAALALALGMFGVASATRWVQLRGVGTDPVPFVRTEPSSSTSPPGRCSDEPCNYLLLGSDSRTGLPASHYGTNKDIGDTFRADTIMLVHTDPALEKAIVLSFPRDLWVNIPGRGDGKINSAFEGGLEGGGPQLMARTITNLTGLPIDHYLYVDLNGFQHVVDTLGGVDVCIPDYYVNTPGWLTANSPNHRQTQVYNSEVGHIVDVNAGLDIEPGCQHLDGQQALAYVRARHLPCDLIPDFSRIGRQQQFLRAVMNQMLRPAELAKAPSLVEPVLASLHRDQGFLPGDLVYLVGQLRGIATGNVEFRAVPGVAAMEGSLSVVRMEPSATQIFTAIRDHKPIGDLGTQLIDTHPSEANVRVAVIDDTSSGKAGVVEEILSSAGFDVTPGIWDANAVPAGVRGSAIVFRPGDDAYAQVVSSYFPGLRLVPSMELSGTQVAVVVTSSYRPASPGQPGTGVSTNRCPSGA